jgi:hypothetical protein
VIRQNLPEMGTDEYRWDGRTDGGDFPSSGVYNAECGGIPQRVVFIRG